MTDVRRVIYSRIEELPTLPVVLPKILSLIESDRSSAADIAGVIAKDPALAAKILKAANSAYYGFSKKIESLEMAVGLLGLNMVRSLALSIGVLQILPTTSNQVNFSQEGLWKHSLATATIMKELHGLSGVIEGGDHVFIIGLLHDIGKVVLDQFFADQFKQALEETDKTGRAVLFAAEKQIMGLDHGEIGAMLLDRWRFPEEISRVIALHHKEDWAETNEKYDIALLRTADALACGLGLGQAGNPVNPRIGQKEIGLLGLTSDSLVDFKNELVNVEEAVNAFYSAVF